MLSAYVVLLAACGGGGDRGSDDTTGASASGNIAASPLLARKCALPRSADTVNPDSGLSYGDMAGSLDIEKSWIRAWVNETYLWYAEVPWSDPAPYVVGATVSHIDPTNNERSSVALQSNHAVVDAYFNSQRTLALTDSGKPKDRFHFTYVTSEWQALSRSGVIAGFGFHVTLPSSSPPRKALVAFVESGSLAERSGIRRGTEIVSVNGVDVVDGSDVAGLNEGLFSPKLGKDYNFKVLDAGGNARQLTLTAVRIDLDPVPIVKTLPPPYERVGYIAFHDHIAKAEIYLPMALIYLKNANQNTGIDDLVVDMRYNGGGFLDIASELAFMIAGEAATTGKFFEQLRYNDKTTLPSEAAQATIPFRPRTLGYFGPPGQDLPQMPLPRLYVITGKDTCSASESFINGLRGVGIEVIQVGDTTCGKPYGFHPADNCGTTYFAVQFQGANFLGFGDYFDGFKPGGTEGAPDSLPGCVVADDFSRPLGDPDERRLSAVLQFRARGSCPRSSAMAKEAPAPAGAIAGQALFRPPVRENRIHRNR